MHPGTGGGLGDERGGMSDNDWWSQFQKDTDSPDAEPATPPAPPSRSEPPATPEPPTTSWPTTSPETSPPPEPTTPPATPPPSHPQPATSTPRTAPTGPPVTFPPPAGTPAGAGEGEGTRRPAGLVAAAVAVIAIAIVVFVSMRGDGASDPVVGTWTHPEEGTIVFDDDGSGSITQSADPVAFTWQHNGDRVSLTVEGSGNVAEATLSGNELTFRPGDFSGDEAETFTRVPEGTDAGESEAVAASSTPTAAPTATTSPTASPTTTPAPTATPTAAPTSTPAPTPTAVVEADPRQSLAAGDCVVGLGLGEDLAEVDCQDSRAEGIVVAAEMSVDIECGDADVTLTSTTTDADGNSTEIGLCIDRLESLRSLFDLDQACEPIHFLDDQLQAVRCDEGDHIVTFVRHAGVAETTDYPRSLEWRRGPTVAGEWSAGDLECGQIWEGRDSGSAIVVSTFASAPYSIWHTSDTLTLAELNEHVQFSIVTSLCR